MYQSSSRVYQTLTTKYYQVHCRLDYQVEQFMLSMLEKFFHLISKHKIFLAIIELLFVIYLLRILVETETLSQYFWSYIPGWVARHLDASVLTPYFWQHVNSIGDWNKVNINILYILNISSSTIWVPFWGKQISTLSVRGNSLSLCLEIIRNQYRNNASLAAKLLRFQIVRVPTSINSI